jgi:hypothetical protein
MIKFDIKGIEYKTPENIKNISIGRFLRFINKVLCNCPPVLDTVYKIDPKKDTDQMLENWNALNDLDRAECYKYFSLVVSFWTGAKLNDVKEYLSIDELTAAFWTVEILLGNMTPDENFVGFDIDGIGYLLPSKHMEKNTVIEFAESAQFQDKVNDLKGGNYVAILDVMSVLCRPAGEVYNEENNEKRKKIFSKLSLDVAINVGFFLKRLNVGLIQTLAICSLNQAK